MAESSIRDIRVAIREDNFNCNARQTRPFPRYPNASVTREPPLSTRLHPMLHPCGNQPPSRAGGTVRSFAPLKIPSIPIISSLPCPCRTRHQSAITFHDHHMSEPTMGCARCTIGAIEARAFCNCERRSGYTPPRDARHRDESRV